MIEIILSSFNQLFNAINIFLQTKDLTLGAILAGLAPFIVIYIKISKENEKKIQRKLVERRQMQIAFNINEILEALKVESKWSIEEIGLSHTDRPSLSKRFLSLQVVTILRRKKVMDKLKSRKLWMAIFGALLPIFNEQFNLGLNNETVISSVGAIIIYILGQAHIDAKKVVKDDVKPTIDGSSDK